MSNRLHRLLLGASALVVLGSGTALAAPDGPEMPPNCTFSKGTTTCGTTESPVITSTETSLPNARTGCVTTTTYTTSRTYFTAHRGTFNSQGVAVDGPAATVAENPPTTSESCPTHGSAALGSGTDHVNPADSCSDYLQYHAPYSGTAYWYLQGNDVVYRLEIENYVPSRTIGAGMRCVMGIGSFTTDSTGAATMSGVLVGWAGRAGAFNFASGQNSAGFIDYRTTPPITFS